MRIIFVTCLATLLLCVSACAGKLKYEEGKDTVCVYGNGTYQVLHNNDGKQEIKTLMNCKYNQCVLTQISTYKNIDNTAYFIGKYYTQEAWCKLIADTNCLYYYIENNSDNDEFIMVYLDDMQNDNEIVILSSFDEFSEKDREIFNGM